MKKLASVFLLFFMLNMNVLATDIKICTDQNFWYPFTFVAEGKSAGLHVAVAKQAIADSGHSYSFIPMEWKKCLSEAKKGSVDAVISASYKDKRAKFLHYPSDASTAKKSAYRITQVEYVVVGFAGSEYEFDGNVQSLPAAVRAPRSYSIVDDLKSEGVKVKTDRSDVANLKSLVKTQKGVVVTLPEIAKRLSYGKSFKGKLKVHAQPIKSKSYFMAISKKGNLTKEEREMIWSNIVKVRENEALINQFLDELE